MHKKLCVHVFLFSYVQFRVHGFVFLSIAHCKWVSISYVQYSVKGLFSLVEYIVHGLCPSSLPLLCTVCKLYIIFTFLGYGQVYMLLFFMCQVLCRWFLIFFFGTVHVCKWILTTLCTIKCTAYIIVCCLGDDGQDLARRNFWNSPYPPPLTPYPTVKETVHQGRE